MASNPSYVINLGKENILQGEPSELREEQVFSNFLSANGIFLTIRLPGYIRKTGDEKIQLTIVKRAEYNHREDLSALIKFREVREALDKYNIPYEVTRESPAAPGNPIAENVIKVFKQETDEVCSLTVSHKELPRLAYVIMKMQHPDTARFKSPEVIRYASQAVSKEEMEEWEKSLSKENGILKILRETQPATDGIVASLIAQHGKDFEVSDVQDCLRQKAQKTGNQISLVLKQNNIYNVRVRVDYRERNARVSFLSQAIDGDDPYKAPNKHAHLEFIKLKTLLERHGIDYNMDKGNHNDDYRLYVDKKLTVEGLLPLIKNNLEPLSKRESRWFRKTMKKIPMDPFGNAVLPQGLVTQRLREDFGKLSPELQNMVNRSRNEKGDISMGGV